MSRYDVAPPPERMDERIAAHFDRVRTFLDERLDRDDERRGAVDSDGSTGGGER